MAGAAAGAREDEEHRQSLVRAACVTVAGRPSVASRATKVGAGVPGSSPSSDIRAAALRPRSPGRPGRAPAPTVSSRTSTRPYGRRRATSPTPASPVTAATATTPPAATSSFPDHPATQPHGDGSRALATPPRRDPPARAARMPFRTSVSMLVGAECSWPKQLHAGSVSPCQGDRDHGREGEEEAECCLPPPRSVSPGARAWPRPRARRAGAIRATGRGNAAGAPNARTRGQRAAAVAELGDPGDPEDRGEQERADGAGAWPSSAPLDRRGEGRRLARRRDTGGDP